MLAENGSSAREAADPPRPTTSFSHSLYYLARNLMRVPMRLCYHLEGVNTKNVPSEGGAILVVNHSSFFDIPALGCPLPRPMRFVGRESLDRVPLMGLFFRKAGAVYIRRAIGDHTALLEIIAAAQSGDLVAVFPEGKRTADGMLQSMRPGVVVAARRADVPIVPVGIVGNFDAFSRNHKFPRLRGKVVTSYGTPMRITETDAAKAMEQVRDAVATEIERAADLWEARTGRQYPYRNPYRRGQITTAISQSDIKQTTEQ